MSLPKECPIGPKKRREPKPDSEAVVLRECLQYLRQCPVIIHVERRNTGAVKFQDGGFVRFGLKGAADIWILIKIPLYELDIPAEGDYDAPLNTRLSGRYMTKHIEIECKRADGKGRQSPDQKKFQEFCDSHGIPYILTTSAAELAEKIQAIVLDS